MGFPCSSVSKESTCNAGDLGLIPGSGRSPGEGNSNPLQYFCLENPTDRGVWEATVYGIARIGHDLAAKPPDPQLTQLAMYYCNRCIILFTQIIYKNKHRKWRKNFQSYSKYLEKCSTTFGIQGLALSEQARRVTYKRGREVGRWQSWSAQLLSRVRLFATPWTVAHRAPLSMGFSRWEYWCGVPFPTPGGSSQSRDRTHVSFFLLHWQADSSPLTPTDKPRTEGSSGIEDGEQAAISLMADVDRTHLCIFPSWRFLCRRLTVLPSNQFDSKQCQRCEKIYFSLKFLKTIEYLEEKMRYLDI